MALVRILAPLVIVLDLGRVAMLGLLPAFFLPFESGGINRSPDSAYVLGAWSGVPWIGEAAVLLTVLCFLLTSAGIFFRPALLTGILLYAQVGHLYPPGDRAIDRILRTMLLILLFSDAHQTWSLRQKIGRAHV